MGAPPRDDKPGQDRRADGRVIPSAPPVRASLTNRLSVCLSGYRAMEKERTKADRKAETHLAPVGAARRLFMERRYAATPTEEIIGFGASFLHHVTARVACYASRWVP